MTVTASQEALDQAVRERIAEGWAVEMRQPGRVIIVRGEKIDHTKHFVIGLVTVGLWWLFVWLPMVIAGGQQRELLEIDRGGEIVRRKA